MGKKSKTKRSGGASTSRKAAVVNDGASASTVASDGDVSAKGNHHRAAKERGTLYSIYKYCTKTVMDWGMVTYRKLPGNQNNKKKNTQASVSLSWQLFEWLGTVAKAKIVMPEGVLKDLRTAISYRKRVGAYYQDVPTASERDHASHQWLIRQLERLEGTFAALKEHKPQQAGGLGAAKFQNNNNNNFGVLADLANLEQEEEEEEEDQEEEECDKNDGLDSTVSCLKPKKPTQKELEEEERSFAVALVLAEIDQGRAKLRTLWEEWATKKHVATKDPDEGDACELMATAACTEYLLMSMTKEIQQTALQFGDDLFDQILRQSYLNNEDLKIEAVSKGSVVTLRNLIKTPELNGRNGKLMTSRVDDRGRVGVRLLPLDPKRELSVKPTNLMLAGNNNDNTSVRLSQIYHAVTKVFDFQSIPTPPLTAVGSETSESVVRFINDTLLPNSDAFNDSLESGSFLEFLNTTVKALVPLWMSVWARYRRDERDSDEGDQNLVLMSVLHDFNRTKKVNFPLTLALLVSIDSAFAAAKASTYGRGERAFEANTAKRKALTLDADVFKKAGDILVDDGFAPAPVITYDLMRHMLGEYSSTTSFVPLISGASLLDGRFLLLYTTASFVLHNVQTITTMCHLYWMLRSEGYLGRIPEIEELISKYPQRAFFKSGVPERGTGGTGKQQKYFHTWQLALGNLNPNSVQMLNGKTRFWNPKIKAKDQSFDGLYVTQLSRLRHALQLKSIPTSDINECCRQLQDIARKENDSLFTRPLLAVAVKLVRIRSEEFPQLAREAEKSAAENNFPCGTAKTAKAAKVCMWAMYVADKEAKNQRDRIGLGLVAGCFRRVFETETNGGDDSDGRPEPLAFIPYVAIDESVNQGGPDRSGGTK